ncbi:MAG: integrase core domain-containing protein [Dehalococcoidales bacterium]|nr:integrase core domain-containing protein [Dehalococcoidales bacterium]
MKTITSLLHGQTRLRRVTELSKEAYKRLKWFDYYDTHGRNGRLTCRHFDISPQTFYRWKRRYDWRHLDNLEDRSHKPKRLRQPTWDSELAQEVLRLREQYPRWGKDKLSELLHEQGRQVSASMVGRILRRLKERGALKEPIPNHISARKRLRQRPFATRKPKDYPIKEIGDIVQVDTLDLRPLPGVLLKHFTAHDVVSKWNVMSVHRQATASTAAHFLNTLQERMPFPVKAIQVDGGPEFEAAFEEECQTRGIRLFVLPPRSPKLNGGVERAHRTHTEEFYEITDSTFDLDNLRQELLEWERTYNTIRPHQALGYLTPLKFLEKQKKGGRVSLII